MTDSLEQRAKTLSSIDDRLTELTTCITTLRAFNGGLGVIQRDIGDLKTDVAVIKQQVISTHNRVETIKGRLSKLDDETDAHTTDIALLKQQAAENKGRWGMIATVVMTVINGLILAAMGMLGLGRR